MANILFLAAVSFLLLAAASVSPAPASAPLSMVFNVGDETGWAVPEGPGAETYNHWAKRNRFRVGDVLGFKYVNDSVLVVNHDDYKQCHTENPMSKFTDGDTKFVFNRSGTFFFISGVPGHCEDGQRMIVRVMAKSTLAAAPATAPPSKAPAASPRPSSVVVGRAPSPVVSAPDTPSYGSSLTPSPTGQPSGASGRLLTGFSIAIGLVLCVVVTVPMLV